MQIIHQYKAERIGNYGWNRYASDVPTSRHTFATLLVIDGVSIYKIQKFLGHKSVNMTERYLKFDLKVAQVNIEEIETFS